MVNVLVIAPHADDETLGCGGVIRRMAIREGANVTVAILTGHGGIQNRLGPREVYTTKRREAEAACRALGVSQLVFADLPSAAVAEQLPFDLNQETLDIVREVAPSIVFCPWPFDLHHDHRRAAASFAVHWRPYVAPGAGIGEVYYYETVSETHLTAPHERPFAPDTWVALTEVELEAKLSAFECYRTQMQDHPSARSVEALRSLAVWRGSQIGAPAAEAFVTARRVLR